MPNSTEDIQPLATFQSHSDDLLAQLKRTQRPIILTIDGKPEAILQDPTAYQRLLDLAAHAEATEGIRQGLVESDNGEGRDARELLDSMRQTYDIPR